MNLDIFGGQSFMLILTEKIGNSQAFMVQIAGVDVHGVWLEDDGVKIALAADSNIAPEIASSRNRKKGRLCIPAT
jgi:hypothetical protein